jgi:hypothetical protein
MQTRKAELSGSVTHFVVQAYRKGKRGKLEADEPKIARDLHHCKVLAERTSYSRAAVIAFSRTGDPDTGDFDEPVILAKYGEVPDFV